MNEPQASASVMDQQRRRARRTAIGLLLVAVAIYVGFILMTVRRSHG
jgi:predicted nucleic acid-binding Zn ribbon protein